MIISFISIKGGVGKTTMVLETAASLANHFNKKVLVIDANFSAPNVALHYNIQPDRTLHDALAGTLSAVNVTQEIHGFDFIPASMVYKTQVDIMNLKKVISQIKDKYDFIILDSAPNFRELVPIIENSEKIFVVTTPDNVTLNTTMKAANMAKAKKTPIEGVIINKIRTPKYELTLKEVENNMGIPVLAKIKDDKKMTEAMFYKKPISLHDPTHTISKEIKRFASALVGVPEKTSFSLFKNLFGKEKVNREVLRQKLYEEQI